MSINHVLQGLREWCEECGDVFITEDYRASSPGAQVEQSCTTLSHHRALTNSDFEWHICDRCRGNGTLGGWPGAYTESDRAEWSDDDYEDYHTTRRPCEDCNGTGKILDITEEAAQRPIVQEWIQDHYDTEATYRQERAMGA